MRNYKLGDIITIGFALFAMFFGAGNLIFPPYLGWELGAEWKTGFLCYMLVDVGMGFMVMLVIAKIGRGSEGIADKLNHKLAQILLGLICLCIGPAIAIPRVASLTYEVAVVPNIGEVNSALCLAVFFGIVWLLSIVKNEVIDIVGKILSPLMVLALIVMIVKGIMTPIGEIVPKPVAPGAVSTGILSGYQTMDMMAAVIFSITIIYSITQKGYTQKRQQFGMIFTSGLVASALLFVVYGGLAFIGATASAEAIFHLSQTELLMHLTRSLLGRWGILLLGIIVALACMTTAIGLFTAISEFFEEKLHIPYKVLVSVFTIISFGISQFGTEIIISMAAPILNLIYPVLIVLTCCCLFGDRMPRLGYQLGAAAAFAVSFAIEIENIVGVHAVEAVLPLSEYGFGWFVPALIFVIIGSRIGKRA